MTGVHIIFDCDGVLVDSEPLSMKVDVEILAENGVVISEQEAHARFVGKTFAAMIDDVSAQYGVRFPADASAQKDLRLLALYERELKVVPGVSAALRRIGHHRYSVASNSPAERVAAALRIANLEPWFDDRITTFEHVPRPKPEPDVFIAAARRAGYAPEDCLGPWCRLLGSGLHRHPSASARPDGEAPVGGRASHLLENGRSAVPRGRFRSRPQRNALTLHCNTPIWASSPLKNRDT
jgi:HAD superfamily hydrolase (TIGR01509 family)